MPRVKKANPAPAYLVPLLTLVATIMLTGAITCGFDYLYPLRFLTVTGAIWFFRKTYVRLEWTWSWLAVANGIVVFFIWIALEPAADHDVSPIADGLASLSPVWMVTWLVFRTLGSVVTVPLAEELAFRGYLIRRLVDEEFQHVPSTHFSWFGLIVTSLLFGLLHGRWVAGSLAGLLYGLTLYRRGQISDAIIAHSTTNAMIAGHVLLNESWWHWS
jgi:CAAX prenyl protease-like protein